MITNSLSDFSPDIVMSDGTASATKVVTVYTSSPIGSLLFRLPALPNPTNM
jgi:hypothetical protein